MAGNASKPSVIRRLRQWWNWMAMSPLDWMQIAVTTRCNALCHYCPRTVYRDRWENRDLPLETFRRLLPVIADTRMIHLQGWGEPFLHPDIFEMIAEVKKTSCRVGTTTNAMLLDRPKIERLVASGMDYVAFSLTGIGEKNDQARRGTQFSQVMEAIAGIAARKRALRIETPAVSIAYLLLRSHLPDIDRIVPALAGLGIQQIVVSPLDFFPNRQLWDERIVPASPGEFQELKALFDRLVREAESRGMALAYHLVSPGTAASGCTENPLRALIVSADGGISPCVFTCVPAPGASHIRAGQEVPCRNLVFGNITDESLPTIWMGEDYLDFRRSFGAQPHRVCQGCPKRVQGSE